VRNNGERPPSLNFFHHKKSSDFRFVGHPNASNLRFVVPAKAGTQLCTRQEDSREKKKRSSLPFFVLVVPAKAGIQFVKCLSKKRKNFLDPGLRRDDETKENEFQLPFLG